MTQFREQDWGEKHDRRGTMLQGERAELIQGVTGTQGQRAKQVRRASRWEVPRVTRWVNRWAVTRAGSQWMLEAEDGNPLGAKQDDSGEGGTPLEAELRAGCIDGRPLEALGAGRSACWGTSGWSSLQKAEDGSTGLEGRRPTMGQMSRRLGTRQLDWRSTPELQSWRQDSRSAGWRQNNRTNDWQRRVEQLGGWNQNLL